MIRKQSGSEDPGGTLHVNVLLIEDNPGDARLIREMLADSKSTVFNMKLADRLSTGLARLAGGNGDFDVILLDLSLPDSSGLDTFVHTYAQAQNVPIVVLGLYDTELDILAVQKGAQDYLVKGQVNSEIVVRAIRYAIERNKAEVHIKHLNSVLKAIRNVNQSIVTETEVDSLLRKSCDALVDARGYDAVWLGLLEDGERFATVAGSGFPDDVSRFRRYMLDGDHPPCIRDALAREETVHVRNWLRECGDCFFDDACLRKEAVITRVEHAGRFYGLLTVLLAPGVAVDDEEKRLLAGVASDMGLALHHREMEEARGKAEDALKESDEILRLVVENMPVMLDAFDDKGNIITWNSECEKVTGFNSREIINNP
ncbi:MAG: response regulator [Methanosarcinales archaeon]|nr:response regulator [Methanosarcinales archaeon]